MTLRKLLLAALLAASTPALASEVGGGVPKLTVTGDCSGSGTKTLPVTCTKTNGANFSPSATTDTTNAANISTGTLPAARLPTPTISTLGGLLAKASATAHQVVQYIDTTGAQILAQLSFSDLSGSLSATQLPAFTGDISTLAGSSATTLATVNSNTGSFGDSSHASTITVNGKGLITAASNTLITPSAIGAAAMDGTGASGSWGISVTGSSATVTGATQTAITSAPNLATIGTISSGVWNGTRLTSSFVPADTAYLDQAQIFTAAQTFTNSDLLLLGSSTGKTTFTSDNAGATNFTLHVPATNDTITTNAATQTLTNKSIDAGEVNSGILAVANGGTGIGSLGTGIATFLGTPSSSNLAAAMTDETGSGALVFATSPTFTTPNLGTPSAGILSNTTGIGTSNMTLITGSASATTFLRGDGSWATPGGSGTVNSGTAGHGAYYATSTNALSDQPLIQFAADGVTIGTQAASANTVNGTVAGNAVWTDTITVGSSSANGLVLQNTTAAASGAQQFSPRINLIGQGWKTNATAGSQSTSWIIENEPQQGAAAPDANLVFSRSVNGGAYTNFLSISPSNAVATFGQNVSANGGNGNVSAGQAGQFNFTGRGILSSAAAGSIQLGAADATSPVAQTLRAQSQITTSNTAGQNWTIIGSLGTGTASGGAIIFQTGLAGSTGATQNTATEVMRITGLQQVGIGTNLPVSGMKLDVNGTVNATQYDVAGAQIAAANLSNGTTGSGSIVLATSPSLTTPNLGTPSAGDLSNTTGIGISNMTNITGTPSSSNFLRGDGSWATPAGGGTPGGASGNVQFNSGGTSFGGDSGLTYGAGVVNIGTSLGIGTATPLADIDASRKLNGILFPTGTSGQRPSSPQAGQTRFNSTASGTSVKSILEAWQTLGSAAWVMLQPLVGGGLETTNSASANATALQGQENALIALGTSTLSSDWGIPGVQIPRGSYSIGSTIKMVPWIKWQTSGTVKLDFSSNSAITGATNATTASSSATLHFASTPAGCVPGAYLIDVTNNAHITTGTQISSTTGTTIIMTQNAASTVGSGDTISCSFIALNISNDQVPTGSFTNFENDANAAPIINTKGGPLQLIGLGSTTNSIGMKLGSELASPSTDQQSRNIHIGPIGIQNFGTSMQMVANQLYLLHFDEGGHLTNGSKGIATSQSSSNVNSGENMHFSGGWVLDGFTDPFYFDTPNIDTVCDGCSIDFNTNTATSTSNDGFAKHEFTNGHIEEVTTLMNCAATTQGFLNYIYSNEKWVGGSAASSPTVVFKGQCILDVDGLFVGGYDSPSNDPSKLFMADSNVTPRRMSHITWTGVPQLTAFKLLVNDDPCFAQGTNTNDLTSTPMSTYSTNIANTGAGANTGITGTVDTSVVWTTGGCSSSKSMKFAESNTTNSYTVVSDRIPVHPGDQLAMDVVWQTTKASSTATIQTEFLYSFCNPAVTPVAQGFFGDTLGTDQALANTWSKMAYVDTDNVPAGACFAQAVVNMGGLAATEIVRLGFIGVNIE